MDINGDLEKLDRRGGGKWRGAGTAPSLVCVVLGYSQLSPKMACGLETRRIKRGFRWHNSNINKLGNNRKHKAQGKHSETGA